MSDTVCPGCGRPPMGGRYDMYAEGKCTIAGGPVCRAIEAGVRRGRDEGNAALRDFYRSLNHGERGEFHEFVASFLTNESAALLEVFADLEDEEIGS